MIITGIVASLCVFAFISGWSWWGYVILIIFWVVGGVLETTISNRCFCDNYDTD
jgi:hypothetical protein